VVRQEWARYLNSVSGMDLRFGKVLAQLRADGLEDEAYLAAIGAVLPDLIEQVQPDLVLYNAGVDPHRGDRLGRLGLSDIGLLQRDRLVLEACLRRRIPVATVIGGGYDDLNPLVERHGLVFRAASEMALLHGL
jgi:acetoin utilization deacetylase AcuC-like enzyme